MRRKIDLGRLLAVVIAGVSTLAGAAGLPLVDAHIHYSHDAWQRTPPTEAVRLLRSSGLKYAFVSSSSWMYDETVVAMLSERLARNYYAGIGEFHAFGDDVDLPVL